mgnify:CR=1 FL=1
MRTAIVAAWILASAAFLVGLAGCHGDSEDSKGTLATTAPVNNNAPEAKNAPAAPGPGPDVPTPGGKRMKKSP